MKIIQSEERKEKRRKEVKKVWGLTGQHQADQYTHQEILNRKREKWSENLFEKIMNKNFPNQRNKVVIHIQEAQ